MWFKLLGKHNNQDSVLYYNNITNELKTQDNAVINPKLYSNEETITYNFTPDKSSCTKQLDVEHLEIVLGLKCNFNCEYCSQSDIRDKGIDITPEKAKQLIQLFKSVGLKVSKSIQLWGGEPLVYSKSLFVLIPLLRKLYPNVSISMPSNGSLLTEKLIDLFVKYNISYYVSTDGCEAKTLRGKAVEDDPKLNRLFRIAANKMKHNFGFSTTPHKDTADSVKIINTLKCKVPQVKVIGTHNVIRCHKADVLPNSIYEIPNNQLEKYSQSIYQVLTNKDLYNIDRPLLRHAKHFLAKLCDQINNYQSAGECNMPTKYGLIIDCLGNVYSCHSHSAIDECIGNIKDIKNVNNIGFTHWSNRSDCPYCPYLSSCDGGCPRMGVKEHEISCKNLKALHSGIFKAVLKQAMNFEMQDIVPIEELE